MYDFAIFWISRKTDIPRIGYTRISLENFYYEVDDIIR